jgi:hypothetical protein
MENEEPKIAKEDFEFALQKTFPSVSPTDQKLYENMRRTLKYFRGKLDTNK